MNEEDFFPGFGRFRAAVYSAPVQLGAFIQTLTFGVLPPLREGAAPTSVRKGISQRSAGAEREDTRAMQLLAASPQGGYPCQTASRSILHEQDA